MSAPEERPGPRVDDRPTPSIVLTLGAAMSLAATAAWLLLDATAPRRLAAIDEGQWLFYASALRDGAVPYRDFWIQFGPAVLYGLEAAFAAFGESLATARSTFWLLNAAGLASAGIGLALLTRSWRWAAIGALLLESNAIVCLALNLNPAFLARQSLPLLAIGLAAFGWRTRPLRLGAFLGAGAVAGVALLSSQEVGGFGLLAVGGAALAARLLGPRHDSWTPVALISAGAAAPIGVWLCAAFALGGLADYLSVSFLDTFAMVSVHQHQELPGAEALLASARALSGWTLAYVPLLLCALALVPAWRGWRQGDRSIAMLLVFASLMWTVNLGRSDRAHAAFAAGPSIALGIVLLAGWRGSGRRVAAAFVALALASMWGASIDRQLLLVSLGSQRERLFSADFPRSGGARIRASHAARLRGLADAVNDLSAPGQAIFVDPHDPALYFLLDRPNPTRFATPVFANLDADRLEIVEDLLRAPPAVILRTRDGLLPGIDYDYYRERLEGVYRGYCRHARFRGPVEIWVPISPDADCSAPIRAVRSAP